MLSIELTERIIGFLDNQLGDISWTITSLHNSVLSHEHNQYVFEYKFAINNILRVRITFLNTKLLADSVDSIKALLSTKKHDVIELSIILDIISTSIIDKNTAILITALGIIKTTFCVDLFNFKFDNTDDKNIINQLKINSTIEETIVATVGTLRWPVTDIEFIEKKDALEYLI